MLNIKYNKTINKKTHRHQFSIQCQLDKAKKSLFHDENIDAFDHAMHLGLHIVKEQLSSCKKPLRSTTPTELMTKINAINLDNPLPSVEEALEELQDIYLHNAMYFHKPGYMAHLNCPITIASIVAEHIIASINSSLDTWDQSIGGTLIEKKLIEWTCDLIGFSSGSDGIFTSGGTQSNLMAILLARDLYAYNQLNHNIKLSGMPREAQSFCILASEVSHFSLQKAAAILGMGHQSIITVPVKSDFTMSMVALEQAYQIAIGEGKRPIMVVGTAGTTDYGSIDDLNHISTFCHENKLWFHVDAAYGGGLLVSTTRRHLLQGIEQADSVTVDYHKSFLQGVSCGSFLVKKRDYLNVVVYHAEYLNPVSQSIEGTPNQVNKSIQTTRRFDALKLWLSLRILGSQTIGTVFDYVAQLADESFDLSKSFPEIEAIHQPSLSTLVFRYKPKGLSDSKKLALINEKIRKSFFNEGNIIIASTVFKDEKYLKITLLNPFTQIKDIQNMFANVVSFGKKEHAQISFL